MATLPTATEVRSIIDTALTDEQIDSIVTDAVLLVETCSSGWSDARYTSILKWVTAHLIASRGGTEGVLTSSRLGDAQDNYMRTTPGDGLKGTTYGQQALALDTNGCLVNLGKRRAFVRTI